MFVPGRFTPFLSFSTPPSITLSNKTSLLFPHHFKLEQAVVEKDPLPFGGVLHNAGIGDGDPLFISLQLFGVYFETGPFF